jgi:hypothetical protein
MIRTCELCGKEFESTGRNASRRKYCNDVHYANCQYCGKQFEITPTHLRSSQIPKCCSKACSNKLKIQKCKETVRSKYGVDNVSQSSEFKAKIRKGLLLKSKQIADSRRRTMVDKYGVEYPMQSDTLKSKILETNEQRYGYTNPAKNSDIKLKISNSVRSKECQQKVQQTNLERYGVSYASQSLKIQDKMKSTNLERYGVEYPTQSENVKSKMIQTLYTTRINDPTIKQRAIEAIHATCKERYGVDWPCQLEQCRQASGAKSTVNDKFKSICESNGILLESEYHLGSYSYDFKVVDQNILIELDPTYTHNVIGNHWNLKGLAYDYHKLKSELAESQGFQCIHIFDWDDCTKILNIIRPKQAVYARQCEILEVSSTDCDSFLNWYHLQNTCRGQKFKLGLYHNGELIQVMAFGKPRYNKNYQWELLRLCTKSGYCVIGGASKLFRYFINNYNPQSTISYCDKSKFKGEVYTEIGMSLKYTTPPAKVWSNGNQKITDNLLRQRGFDQIFHTEFGKGTSNDELMLKHGWLPVYDCGQAVYEWINMEV